MKHLIVGLDPGTKTAVCLMNLDGKIVHLASEKHVPQSRIIETITSHGRPSAIATDRAKPPSLVEKVASSFGVPIHAPERDADRRAKDVLTSAYECEDDHQKDALAAALLAWNSYKEVFARVDRKADVDEQDRLKDLLVRKKVHNITEALRGQIYA